MNDELRSFTEVDRLLHEPARLVIVTILYAASQADFLYLLRETGLTKGNLSAHLSKLESAGYVKIKKTFRGKIPQTLVSLSAEGKEAFETYRQRLKDLLDQIT